jgi:hypothetical protein
MPTIQIDQIASLPEGKERVWFDVTSAATATLYFIQ